MSEDVTRAEGAAAAVSEDRLRKAEAYVEAEDGVVNRLVGSLSPGHVLGHVVPCRCAYVCALRRCDKARSRREKPELFAGRCARGRVH